MRPRYDFYTFCPKCEVPVRLTLAAKLQASRGGQSGCSCTCKNCQHEWVSIQEWIFRDLPRSDAHAAARPAPAFVHSANTQGEAGISRGFIAATAICHTDLGIYKGQYANLKYPVVMGHESTGVVEAAGENVTHTMVGDPVIIKNVIGE